MSDDESKGISAFKVSVKTPVFNRDDAEIWFHQLEAQFSISGIKTDQTKYVQLFGSSIS